MVDAGTNAFERNVSGNRIMSEMPCTAAADRAITPKNAKIQLSDHAETMTSTVASSTPASPPSGR